MHLVRCTAHLVRRLSREPSKHRTVWWRRPKQALWRQPLGRMSQCHCRKCSEGIAVPVIHEIHIALLSWKGDAAAMQYEIMTDLRSIGLKPSLRARSVTAGYEEAALREALYCSLAKTCPLGTRKRSDPVVHASISVELLRLLVQWAGSYTTEGTWGKDICYTGKRHARDTFKQH